MTETETGAKLTGVSALVALKGVGPSLEQKLQRLGLFVVRDLLLHLPARYEDRTRYWDIAQLTPGTAALCHGEIVEARITYGQRRALVVTVTDATGYVQLRFFHFSRRQQQDLQTGAQLYWFGEPRFVGQSLEIIHPEYRLFDGEPPVPGDRLAPVYPTTEGLGQARLRSLTEQALKVGWDGYELPGLPSMHGAIETLHRPPAHTPMSELDTATRRLALDELLAHYLLLKERQVIRQRQTTQALPQAQGLGRTLLARLGFELTGAQKRCLKEIFADLDQQLPMMRLVQGDVGSGKTILAAFAANRAAEHGTQTALMAPTEILAEQHYINFSDWLAPLGIEVTLLTGTLSAPIKRKRLERIRTGEVAIVIGTHALFQRQVEFHDLALAVIDEQHRFGVHQRMSLRHKGGLPHQLIMTATPIPRTLTMALYADLNVSIIDELPKNRQPINTRLLPDSRRQEVIDWLAPRLAAGDQVYWVCNLIDPSDDKKLHCVTDHLQLLQAAFPQIPIALLHGRLSANDKQATMAAFKAGELQLLLATTVIEVGVDVPNASVMVIENSERLGLSQLHQLRGRVGRGHKRSYCVLLHTPSLGAHAEARLQALRDSQDGFVIAERDLELRGPGDVLGTRQTGDQQFRVADLGRDSGLTDQVIQMGDDLLRDDPKSASALLSTWATPDWGYGGV